MIPRLDGQCDACFRTTDFQHVGILLSVLVGDGRNVYRELLFARILQCVAELQSAFLYRLRNNQHPPRVLRIFFAYSSSIVSVKCIFTLKTYPDIAQFY